MPDWLDAVSPIRLAIRRSQFEQSLVLQERPLLNGQRGMRRGSSRIWVGMSLRSLAELNSEGGTGGGRRSDGSGGRCRRLEGGAPRLNTSHEPCVGCWRHAGFHPGEHAGAFGLRQTVQHGVEEEDHVRGRDLRNDVALQLLQFGIAEGVLEIGKKHALFVVHVLQVVGDEEGEPAIKAGEQLRALVIGRDSNAFEQAPDLGEAMQVVVVVFGGMSTRARAAGIEGHMKHAVFVVEMGAAHSEVVLDPCDEAQRLRLVAGIGGADRDKVAHMRGADSLVNGAVGVMSGLWAHVEFLLCEIWAAGPCA